MAIVAPAGEPAARHPHDRPAPARSNHCPTARHWPIFAGWPPDGIVAFGGEVAQAAARGMHRPAPWWFEHLASRWRRCSPTRARSGFGHLSRSRAAAQPAAGACLLPAAHTIGVLVPTPRRRGWLCSGPRPAAWNSPLDEIPVTDDLSAARALRPRLSDLDAVLLPPDATVINEWSLKPLLLMTIRQGVPTFGGLTARYVDAGVLAAVVADEERLPAQIQTILADLTEVARPRRSIPWRSGSRSIPPWRARWASRPKQLTAPDRCFRGPKHDVLLPRSLSRQHASSDPGHRPGPGAGRYRSADLRGLSGQPPAQPAAAGPARSATGRPTGRRPEYGLATGALEQLPAMVEATVQPATAILGTPVRSVIVTDPDGRPLYRRAAAAPPPPAPETLADLTAVPAEEDRARFAAPVLLRPLMLSAAAPFLAALGRGHGGTVRGRRPSPVATTAGRDLGLVLLTFGAAGLAHWTGRRLSESYSPDAIAIRRIKTAISPRACRKPT